ncbi:MAG: rod-binding protein [Bdellovibrionaceae bacterium]|nr:rod-binding protein [Pseudobdellovibrionaceae bacterium]
MSEVTRLQRGYQPRAEVTNEQKEAKIREVAEMYEKHFLREMVKSMRATVGDGGLIQKNQAEKIFSEQLDEQYVENWGKKGGVGLADLIQDQLMQRFGEQMGLRFPTAKPQGPVALDAASKARLQDGARAREARVGFQTTSNAAEKQVNFKMNDPEKLTREVAPPWSGRLTEMTTGANGEQVLGVDHGNGFRSLLKFQGELVTNLRPGPVEAGQALGAWDSGRGDMNWTLEFRPDSITE